MAHADVHDACTSSHSDEQAQWARDLREAAELIAAPTAPAAGPQQAVAWIWKYANGDEEVVFVDASKQQWDPEVHDVPTTITPLYTHPAPACGLSEDQERKPLTRSEINKLSGQAQIDFCLDKEPTYEVALARSIERAHGIGLTHPDATKETP